MGVTALRVNEAELADAVSLGIGFPDVESDEELEAMRRHGLSVAVNWSSFRMRTSTTP